MGRTNEIIKLCMEKGISLNRVLDKCNLPRLLLLSELDEWLQVYENFQLMLSVIENYE